MTRGTLGLALAAATGLAGCSAGSSDPGEVPAFDGIAAEETIHALGTEPFWRARIAQGAMLYTTPEQPDGISIAVSRFAGNGGLGFTGELGGAWLQMAVTPGECSDGMSDRRYPYTVTLEIGGARREGCAYTDQQPFAGEEAP